MLCFSCVRLVYTIHLMIPSIKRTPYSCLLSALLICFAGICVAAPVKVACVGDSVTYGYKLEHRVTDAYPAQLQRLLGSGYDVENFGVSGTTLLRRGHHPYYLTDAFKNAISFHPDLVVIHLGLNDTDPRDWPDYRGEFRVDYSWLIAQFRQANPSVRVYICILTPIFESHPRFASSTPVWAEEIRDEIPTIAAANHTQLIDLHTPLAARVNLFSDAVHPNADGASIIARTVYQALSGSYGGLHLPQGFDSHMVLPEGEPLHLTGKADRGEAVSLQFGKLTISTKADEDGDWSLNLPAQRPGGPFVLRFIAASRSITLDDVYFGELWLCSGQSNMDFSVGRSTEASLAQAANNLPIRLLHYKPAAPTDDVVWSQDVLNKVNELEYFSGQWESPNPASVRQFSAVGYFFALHLYQTLKVPIGIVQVAVGGSVAESWIDRRTMDDDPLLVSMMTHWRTSDYLMPWVRERAARNLADAHDPLQRHPYEPSYNFEAGIAPLVHLPIKGVIWYQGESNTNNPELYAHIFPELVQSWRKNWGKDLPFFYVQLSGLDRPSWPYFRDLQRRLAEQIPNSGMVVTSDLGEAENVHYHRKKPVGDRLAELVLRRVYRVSGVYGESPTVLTASRMGGEIKTVFKDTDGALKTTDGEPVRGFQLRDSKGNWRPVSARIRGNTVWITDLDHDTDAVAYAWKPFPNANLVNAAHLPASTFFMRLR